MKRPLCLIGTTLAMTAGLASPIPLSDNHIGRVNNAHVVPPVDGPPVDVEEYEPYDHAPIVPVPPAAAVSAEDPLSSSGNGQQRKLLKHRPHPSYLNQTTSSHQQQHHQRQQRQRNLHHITTGTFHNLVLLLRFSDHTSRNLPTQADISRLYNSQDTTLLDNGLGINGDDDDDIVPTGSVRQVYHANSHGSFKIETTVVDWITLDHPESYYANGNHGFSKFKHAIIEGLEDLNAKAGFDFGEFDLDENGSLDGLGVLHSGYGAEFAGSDCKGAENELRIWSHKGGLTWDTSSSPSSSSRFARGEHAKDDNVIKVRRYYVSSSLRGKCHSKIVRMGVICHELGHYLGLPDLYDETFDGAGLGAYDFMSQSWGWDGSGLYPPNLSAWSKLQVGWAEAVDIVEDGTYELQASTLSNKVYKIDEGYPDGEYLLIENRQPNGYDSKITVGGLAIYHIDENANGQHSRGYPTQSHWPSNGQHYRVAMLAADGKYDLERGENHGDEGDLWHASSALRELKSRGDMFPNTDTYQDGHVENTGLRIFEFGNGGDVMTFRVKGLGNQATTGNGPSKEEVVSLDSMFASKVTPQPTTSEPTPQPLTPAPTTTPPTPKPVTSAPSKQPSISPVTFPPTSHPTSSQPTTTPISSFQSPIISSTIIIASPTHPPTSWDDEVTCAGLCVAPIALEECPSKTIQLADCSSVNVGELCDADGECDTNQFLNNCGALDVYRRVDCNASNAAADAVAVTNSTVASRPITTTSEATTTAAISAAKEDDGLEGMANWNTHGTEANVSAEDNTLEGMTNWSTPIDDLSQSSTGTEQLTLLSSLVTASTDSPTGDPLSAVPTKAPTRAPSAKPTVLMVNGSKPDTNNDVVDHQDHDNDCPYYPGWNLGLTYCLKDCHQPLYMKNSSIFEFASLDECCDLHYQGHESCKIQSLRTIKEKYSTLSESLASVSGQIWKDANGNNWRDANERQMGSGVHNVLIDLYKCDDDDDGYSSSSPSAPSSSSKWIKSTRTSFDGSYLLDEIVTPASYFVHITSPVGYHFHSSEENRPWRDDFNAEGRSSCMGFTSNSGAGPGSMDVILNAGLIPDSLLVNELDGIGGKDMMVTKTELVSEAAALNYDGVAEDDHGEELEGPPAYVDIHTKSRTYKSQGNQQELNDGGASSSPAISSTLHTKSFLRGSSSSSASSFSSISTSTPAVITVRPTDDTTIQSKSNMKFVGGTGELRVGPQLSWHHDILLKFNITPFALTGSHQNNFDYRAAKKAVLRLYSLASSPSGGVVNFAPSNDWTEKTVDWTSAPDAATIGGGHVLAKIGQTRPNTWVEVDVTGMLLTDDGIATLRITGEESNHSWVAEYSSKENVMGHPSPELRVYF